MTAQALGMSTAAARPRWLPRDEPHRTVRFSLEGIDYDLSMTRAEERAFRSMLRPYIARARLVQTAPSAHVAAKSDRLSQRLRQARVQALLGLQGEQRALTGSSLDGLIERAAEVYALSLADQTRATYRRRWTLFEVWCRARGLSSLPANGGTVMAFLTDLLGKEPQPSLSTLRGFVNAINRVHREYDLRRPSDDPALGMLMRGLSRTLPRQGYRTPISAMRIEELRAVCRHLDHPDPAVVRDAALLRLSLEGMSPGILARLRWQEVRFDRDRVLLGERTAKNGQVVSWREVKSRQDRARCPVAALQRWRSLAGTNPPLVFTVVDHDGHREARSLRPSGVKAVISSRLDSLTVTGEEPGLASAADLLHEVAADVLRDRALLLLGFAMAARRGEISNLRWGDLRVVDEGLIVTIRRSKTDLTGRGTDVGVPWGRSVLTCPVRAITAWRERVEQQLGSLFGPTMNVFVKVGRAGRIVAAEPLTPEAVTRVVRRRLEAAGVEGHWGGRSLRAGLITSAAELDIALEVIAAQSRHASLDSLVRYVRNQDVFLRNAVDRIGM